MASVDRCADLVEAAEDEVQASRAVEVEVEIFHPNRPERGTVRVTEDGALWWRSQLRDQPLGAAGLDLAEITSSIVRAIGSAQVAKCEEMRARESGSIRVLLNEHG